jgi:transcriptional regulator with XRE-family HTH domain
MEEVVMRPTDLIAEAIARERRRAGLSLSALAERAGLAKSTLSQLEAGKGNPGVETLWAIAAALGVPFSYLFAPAAPARTLIRRGAGTPVEAERTAFRAVLLADCPLGHRRDIYRIELAAGAVREASAHPAGTVEHVVAIDGRLRVGPTAAAETLEPGDYYRYPADQAHAYTAEETPATFLVIMETPR